MYVTGIAVSNPLHPRLRGKYAPPEGAPRSRPDVTIPPPRIAGSAALIRLVTRLLVWRNPVSVLQAQILLQHLDKSRGRR